MVGFVAFATLILKADDGMTAVRTFWVLEAWETYAKICEYVDEANKKADEMDVKNPWISKHWTGTRAYYTETNGKRIDAIREYIQTIPEEFRDFVMAPLLVEC